MSKIPTALRKFLLAYLVLHLVAAGIFVWVLASIVRQRMINDARLQMVAMAQILAEHISGLPQELKDSELPGHLDKLGQKTGYRYTIIQHDGTIVYDSDTEPEAIRSGNNPPELRLAEQDGTGFSERFSNNLQIPMFYVAIRYDSRQPLAPGGAADQLGFIRVATPAISINDAIRSVQAYVWLFALIVSSITALVMVYFATRAMQPLSLFSVAARKIGMGQYDSTPTLLGRRDEWGLLAVAFRRMQRELESRERRTLENSARLEAVLSSMIEGVIAVAPDDTVMLANNAACRMLSVSQPDIVGRKLLEVVRIPELGEAVEKTRTQQTFSRSEFQTFAPNRKTISARVSVLVKQSADEESVPSITLVMHDVTELRQLENMRRDFVANVSHELKTPLSSILAYAETLKLGAIHDEQKNIQFVDQIESQAQMLNQQIQDLLQLARVEAGKEVWDIGRVSINEVCSTAVKQFASEAANQNIELELELDHHNPTALADADGLLTIVNNLVSNAIHYTPSGGRVTLITEVTESEAVIKVRDTGIGIASEHHARIFERFYRVDKARSRDKGGTGLGLSIVKHITQSFGGMIELQSELGKGTTFCVRFPLSF